MDYLAHLNSRQREAVEAPAGAILVLAGPGSGKTRVLTYRIAYIIQAWQVPASQIMAVTFTNKAAREMKERLLPSGPGRPGDGLLDPYQISGLMIGTFHSVCARILRREISAIDGWNANFVIFDRDDQLSLVRQALADLDLDEKRFRPQSVHAVISNAKNDLITPDRFQATNYQEEVARRVYARYQDLLRENNAFDFDDLLMKTVQLFRRRGLLLEAYQQRYQHILVDEFQDTNMAQYELVKMLAGKHGHIFAVADEDQSIYSWRGADFRNVERFRRDFPDHRLILLEENYRSTGNILEAAKNIIRRNIRRVDKDLFTQRGTGARIRLIEAYDEREEAQFVASEISRLEVQEQIAPGNCAIMYRTNAQSRALEEEFIRRGMPYQLVRGTRFYERREIKDIIAYLRLIHNPHDRISMARIINTPPRGIGAKTMADLERWSFEVELSLYETLRLLTRKAGKEVPAGPPSFGSRAQRALLQFMDLLDELIEISQVVTLPELFDRVLSLSEYQDYVRDGSEEGEDRWENLMELRRATQEFSQLPSDEAMAQFLEQVALVADVDALAPNAQGPAMLTLHAAKGLEFPVVFIVGLDEEILPHKRSLEDADGMEEERRLCYVGVTRAKDYLYLVHTFRRTIFGQNNLSQPSRFLSDIPRQLLETRPQAGRPVQSALRSENVRQFTRRISSRTDDRQSERAGTASTPSTPPFQAGDRVRHAKFGEGIVIGSRLTGDDQEIEVNFRGQGVKRLVASLAPLEKVG